jgi:acyl-CoA hydrolase
MSSPTEKIAARFQPPYKLAVMENFNLSTSYSTGGDVYNSKLLRQIERAAVVGRSGHIEAQIVTGSISGNAFKMIVYTGGSTSQPAAATDLSAKAITVLLEGL